jgi:hypothetical protein
MPVNQDELAFTQQKEIANSILSRQAGRDERTAASEGDARSED